MALEYTVFRTKFKAIAQINVIFLFIIVLFLGLGFLSLTQNLAPKVLQREALADAAFTSWSFHQNGGVITGVFQNKSSVPSGEHLASLTLSARFFTNRSEVYGVYNFISPVNVLGTNEIVSWLYADGTVAPQNNDYFYSASATYSYGVFLYDINGNWKGLGHVPITWSGWAEVVLPSSFQPNDASAGWNDSFSLRHIKAVLFYFEPEGGVDNKTHTITITAIEKLNAIEGNLIDWVGAVLTIVLTLTLFLTPLVLARNFSMFTRSSFFNRFEGILKPLMSPRGATIYLVGIIIRLILIPLTPLSSDFINIAYAAGPAFPSGNIFSVTAAGGSLWILVFHFLYRLWLMAPVDHPSLLEIFPGNLTYPTNPSPIFYFLTTPGSVLFLLTAKSLLIMFDMAIGFLVYSLVHRVTKDQSKSLLAFTIWILNPVSLLTGLLWGGADLITAFFLLFSVYLLDGQRRTLGAVSYGVSVGTKLFPGLLLPIMILLSQKTARSQANYSSKARKYFGKVSFVAISLLAFLFMITPSFLLGGRTSIAPELGRIPDFYFFFGPTLTVFTESVGLTPVFFVLILFIIYYGRHYERLTSIELVTVGVVSLFTFSQLYPQFMIWLLPFLVVTLLTQRRERLLYMSIIVILSFDLLLYGPYFATWGHSLFFYPITDSYVQLLSNSLYLFQASQTYATLRIGLLIGSLFTGFCLGFLYLLLNQESSEVPSS